MKIKPFTPKIILSFYERLKWINVNYRKIKYNSEIFHAQHGPISYNTDGLATSNNCDFINAPKFVQAYSLAKATNPWPNFTSQWRVYIVCWFADLVKNLDGDYVECGVNTGASSRAIIDYINFNETKKRFYLMDTFEGIDAKYVSDEEKKIGILNYQYNDCYKEVVKTFSGFNVEIIKGSIPDTLIQCKAQRICYLAIDMNNVLPEIAALEYFWDKIVNSGVVILDDYGFPQHILQKNAFDKFAKEKNIEILSLPTGQGIIIKH